MATLKLTEAPAQIWLALAPVDMRRGIDGLSSIVQQALGHSPCAGSAFVFHNRSGNRWKVLLWEGNGVGLRQRRLHQGRFVWPKANDACFSLTHAQRHWLITGVDWRRLSADSPAHLQA
jgi:transposase